MDNPFKKIFSQITTSFKGDGSGGSALGIDIGTSAIKVVEIKRRKGRAVLETYGAISLGTYADLDVGRVTYLTPEKTAEALKEVLKQSGVSTNSCALSIPVQSSLIFTIELPPQVGQADLGAIITTEARKYIPVPITEVSIDYFMLPKKELSFKEANDPTMAAQGAEKMKVLVIATQNDAIQKYRSIVSQTSLEAGFLEIEVFSSIRSNFEHELSLVLLMDLGASRTKLSLVEFGTVESYHTVNRGGADITDSIAQSLSIPFVEAEKRKKEFGLFGDPGDKNLADIIKLHTDYIFSETNNVLLGYEKKYNRTISKVILTGGGSLLKGIKEVAQNTFQVEVEIGRPFGKVETPAFLEKVLEATGPEFAVALGLALRKLQ
jgi:type IV pilus assembly protein PilM